MDPVSLGLLTADGLGLLMGLAGLLCSGLVGFAILSNI